MRARSFIAFIAVTQTILFLAHYFLYQTWTAAAPTPGALWLKLGLAFASVSFVVASLLAHRSHNIAVRALYKASAVWLGLLSFLFVAAILAWTILGIAHFGGQAVNFHRMVEILFTLGSTLGIYGVFNAGYTRITRITVRLANLPEAWRGRRAALISDVHLGHVRNGSFLRRLVTAVLREEPHAIFIAGDLYDGTSIDTRHAAAPLQNLTAPYGVYFVAGNHEQFRDDSKYLSAVEAAGVRVLRSEKVEADGLQIIGIPYNNATQRGHLAAALESADIDRDRASILVVHAPDHPEVAEAAGVSLQLSGHTHLGQYIPFSWFARRTYRQFVYGLSRIGKMQVFTSSGAGTWGPPLRLGSNPEIVMLEFERA